MSDSDQDPEYELLMPLVVCKSNGGPYDDKSFVVGMRYSEVMFGLQTLPLFGIVEYTSWVEPDLVPQLDLLAMHYGWTVTTVPCSTEGCEEEWVHVKFTKVLEGEPHA